MCWGTGPKPRTGSTLIIKGRGKIKLRILSCQEDEDDHLVGSSTLLSQGRCPTDSTCISYPPINTQTPASPFFRVPDLHFHLSAEHFHVASPLQFRLDVFQILLRIVLLPPSTHTCIDSSSRGLHAVTGDETSQSLSISPSSPEHSTLSLPPGFLILPPKCGSDPFTGFQHHCWCFDSGPSSSTPGSYNSLLMGIPGFTPSLSPVHPACNHHSKLHI